MFLLITGRVDVSIFGIEEVFSTGMDDFEAREGDRASEREVREEEPGMAVVEDFPELLMGEAKAGWKEERLI